MTNNLLMWLVPLLPFAGFTINIFMGRRMPKVVSSAIACGSVLGSAIIAWVLFGQVVALEEGKALVSDPIRWIHIPGTGDSTWMQVIAEHKLVVDRLTCVMLLVITNIGFLIHLYSAGYMAEEKRFSRYFAYLNLFTGFMLILVMGGNLLLMFVGWEGVGLCSYLLISFWFEKRENAAAGMKAFVTNRVGDFAFTIGVLLLFVYLGTQFGVWTVDFGQITQAITTNADKIQAGNGAAVMTAVGILLFVGATGKSAQIPLYTWLPDAMAGPTPVSALIHAATMVTAGVYMIARMNVVYSLSPTAMTIVAVVGGLTALFAGTIGIAQNDIKKVLAYSTVSQLGFMFMGVGVGAYAAGIFHLMTHAFFKACLFLGSGSVIHGMGGEQDIRKMGGLKKYMPITYWTFLIATIAIAGIPPLAGFWSKDEILWRAASSHDLRISGWVIWFMGWVAAGFTAFYMTRLVVMTFWGELRTPAAAHAHSGGGAGLPDWMNDEEKKAHGHDAGHASDHGHGAAPAHDAGHGHDDAGSHGHGHGHAGTPHESPPSMTLPLIMLAILSLVGGFIGLGAWTHFPNYFEHWLEPVWAKVGVAAKEHGAHSMALELLLVGASIFVAVAGILFALSVYWKRKGEPAKAFAEKNKELYELVRDKYRIDEFYQGWVLDPLLDVNEAMGRFDAKVIDGAVNGAASAGARLAGGAGLVDNEVVDGAVNATAHAAQTTGRAARRIQSGNIRKYLASAVIGGLIVIGVYCVHLRWEQIRRFFEG